MKYETSPKQTLTVYFAGKVSVPQSVKEFRKRTGWFCPVCAKSGTGEHDSSCTACHSGMDYSSIGFAECNHGGGISALDHDGNCEGCGCYHEPMKEAVSVTKPGGWHRPGNDWRSEIFRGEFYDQDNYGKVHSLDDGSFIRYGGTTLFYTSPHCAYTPETVKRCYAQIDRADAVFVYLNESDAFNTFLEVGYAIGKKIPVYLHDSYAGRMHSCPWWFLGSSAAMVDRTVSTPIIPYELRHYRTYKEWYHNAYLKSEHWKLIRQEALEAAKGRCQLCNKANTLQVHHRTYDRVGCEDISDLTVLCRECHGKFHDK